MCDEREGILREARSVVQNSLYRRRSKRFIYLRTIKTKFLDENNTSAGYYKI